MAARNPFEVAGRRRKRDALVRYIDGNVLRRGLSPAKNAEHVIHLLTNVWTPQHWELAAKRASKLAGTRFNAPSPETQIAVLEVYRQRAVRAAS